MSATSLAAPARPVVRVSPAVWLVSGLGIAAVAVVVGSVTIPRYFQLQMQSRQVWEEMSAAQQVAGQTLKRYSATDLVYLSPVYLGLPSVKYIAPGAEGQEWPGMQALPLSSTDARGATIVLDPPSAADISSLPAIYPHAQIQPLQAPSDPAPLAYVVRVPAEDIAGLHGVRAGVQPAGGSAPAPERALSDFTFDWSKATAGVARLTATLQTTAYGPYSFDWQTAGPKTAGALTVDGRPVTPGVALPLAVGLHTVVATDTLSSGTGTARLLWAPPGQPTPAPVPAAALFDPQRIEPHGLTGYYRRGPTGEGPPDLARVDPVISFYFQHTALERPYHVEWRGRLYAPQAGVYTLSTEQLSSSTLTLDGEEVLVNRNPNSLQGVTRPLTAGWHSIKLAYLDDQGYSHMYLYWTPPGYPQSIIPSAFLWPDLSQYPTAPAGGWPTLSGSQSGAAPGGPPPTAAPASAAPPDSGPAGPAGRPLNPSVTLGLNGAPCRTREARRWTARATCIS